MVANPAYIIGENKVVALQLESTKGDHFVVKEATYKLTLDDVDGTNVKSSVSTLTTAKGTYCYTQTLSVASVKKTVYAKGYIIFRNETTGEIVYLYTDLATSNPTNTAN